MSVEYYLSLLRDDKNELTNKANEIREEIYGNQITFSRNVFVPVTHQCRNRCGYCGFVSDDPQSWILPEGFQEILAKAVKNDCKEVLLTLGEKPEEKYTSAKNFLKQQGFENTVAYVQHLCELTLEKSLLPHSNLGVLTFDELKIMKEVNASLGLMLETHSDRLMKEGEAHEHSPGKNPELRLEVIKNAGKLKIPFTTGILIGIGEIWEERIESLKILSKISEKFNHIQEVIIQNFNPQKNTPMENNNPPTEEEILLSLSLARNILPPNVSLQIPPNLNRNRILQAIDHGANDLGGISPVTIDYINPNMPWYEEEKINKLLSSRELTLEERLPVYPSYEKYLNSRVREIIKEYTKNEEIIST